MGFVTSDSLDPHAPRDLSGGPQAQARELGDQTDNRGLVHRVGRK